MSKLPLVTAKQFEKFLIYLGFKIKRQKGSHVFLSARRCKIYYTSTSWETSFIPVVNTSDIKRDKFDD